MRYGTIVFGIVGVLALVIVAGLLHRAGSQTQPEDPGEAKERALATAKRFLNTVGLPIPAEKATITERIRSASPNNVLPDVWEVRWGGTAVVEVGIDGKTVIAFSNHARTRRQLRGIERTGTAIWRNDDEARAYLWKVANAIGMPTDAQMDAFSYYGDNTPDRGDTNRAGCAYASFRVRPYGYPFLGPGPGARLTVDPQDGVLVYYFAVWDGVILPTSPPPSPTVSRDRAEAAATEAFLRHTRPQRRDSSAPTDAKLGWIAANGAFGSVHPWVTKPPWKVRLAWVISFGRNAVYVDPYDGSILGGRP
ncbi:MAG: hypothetical protein GX446_16590 [Chthonomonadales bacterium]|nr:hypothetical protein [Chthonomonadales bacterium]